MNKEKQLEILNDFVMTITTIQCDKCSEESVSEFDDTEGFYTNGWRATENTCYCPNCAKKYIKKK